MSFKVFLIILISHTEILRLRSCVTAPAHKFTVVEQGYPGQRVCGGV